MHWNIFVGKPVSSKRQNRSKTFTCNIKITFHHVTLSFIKKSLALTLQREAQSLSTSPPHDAYADYIANRDCGSQVLHARTYESHWVGGWLSVGRELGRRWIFLFARGRGACVPTYEYPLYARTQLVPVVVTFEELVNYCWRQAGFSSAVNLSHMHARGRAYSRRDRNISRYGRNELTQPHTQR